MPGVFGEHARAQTQPWIRASAKILGEQGLAFGVSDEVGEKGVEMLDRHRVVVVPPDKPFGGRVADHELVLGAASGMHARVGDKRAMRGDLRFVALQRMLIELRRSEIPVDRGKIAEAKPVRAEVEIVRPVFDHPDRSPKGAPRCTRANPSNFVP